MMHLFPINVNYLSIVLHLPWIFFQHALFNMLFMKASGRSLEYCIPDFEDNGVISVFLVKKLFRIGC